VLLAYTEEGLIDDTMLAEFETQYKVRYEDMKPEDSATFYYCFTKAGFKGSGVFYKYIQKAVTKTIRAFEGPHLRLMFYKFDDEKNMRLNRGVRGRLIEHCKYLLREKQLKGFDANEIYENTCQLPYEGVKKQNNDTIDMSFDAEKSDLDEVEQQEDIEEDQDTI